MLLKCPMAAVPIQAPSFPRTPIRIQLVTDYCGGQSAAKSWRSRQCRAVAAQAVKQAQASIELPAGIQNATAVLEAPNGVSVYVLGISHVSKDALQQIQELIAAVRPDIVLVELCKERTGLLVDANAPPPRCWHAVRVELPGLPTGEGWPAASELVEQLLACRGSSPVTASEIEDDAITLLSTGLFRSVRPVAKPPVISCDPAFIVDSKTGRLQTVAPLGALQFVVEPRLLPALQEVALQTDGSLALDAEQAQMVADAALACSKAGTPSLACLLQARHTLLQCVPEGSREQAEVVFSGAESGKVTGVVRLVPQGERRSLTGLEGGAVGGQGWGIEAFKRQAKQSVSAGGGLRIELGPTTTAQPQRAAASSAAARPLRPWTAAELAQAETSHRAGGSAGGGGGNPLATYLTQTYAGFQAKAGKTVGISPGAAWRTAMQAAVAVGAQQVHLGDRPAGTTAERLAAAIWANSSLQLLASIPASLASAVIVWQGLEPGAGSALAVAAAALLPLVVGAWPVAAPLLEIAQFASKSAADLEELVRVKEPLQADAPVYKLWGEDALLDWPGAMDPVIHERDAYMVKALLAAALGRPEGLTPAYVLSQAADGRSVLQYAQPEGGNAAACPPGTGAGAYQPLPAPKVVVGVVGTAHVRGMVAAWRRQAMELLRKA